VTTAKGEPNRPIHITIKIFFSGKQETLYEIKRFLEAEGVLGSWTHINVHDSTNHWGHSGYLSIQSQTTVAALADKLLPHVFEKHEHLEIIAAAVRHKEAVVASGQLLKDNFAPLFQYRERLHALAKKGRKELRKYSG
jgi:hypothetical protein